MTGDSKTILVGITVALCGFLIAGALMPSINYQRQSEGLAPEVGSMPAEIGLLQAATGSFRGLAIDVLWVRAQRLKLNASRSAWRGPPTRLLPTMTQSHAEAFRPRL